MAPFDPEDNSVKEEGKSVFGVIVHSFFVVPFLIAVFSVLLFAAVRILTVEEHTVYDYLEDVKAGGMTKRWQAAFELSKILGNPKLVPTEARFEVEMISAFEHAEHDDDRVRQYLALAMGRSGNSKYVEPLLAALKKDKEENLYALIYSLGLLQDKRATSTLKSFLDHPQARIRLVTVMALGNIGDSQSLGWLKNALNDPEPNVQWDAAIALAKSGDHSGNEVLKNVLRRDYLAKFPEVDLDEQNHVILVALDAASKLNDPELNDVIKNLSETDQSMQIRRAAMEVLK